MNDDWVKVYATNESYKASLLGGLLEEANIESVQLNKQDSAYLLFGQYEVYVKNLNVIKAKHLINKSLL